MKDHIKYIFPTVLPLLFALSLHAQVSYNEDSLKSVLERGGRDTARVNILLMLSESFFFRNPDTSLLYSEKALELSRELNFTKGILDGLFQSSEAKRQLGRYAEAIRKQTEILELGELLNDEEYQSKAIGFIGLNYRGLHDYDRAIKFLRRALDMRARLSPQSSEVLFSLFLGNAYLMKNNTDSAFYFLRTSERRYRGEIQLTVFKLTSLGNAFSHINSYDSMNYYYRKALRMVIQKSEAFPNHVSGIAAGLSGVFISQNQLDSAFYFARLSYKTAERANLSARVYESGELLSNLHRRIGNYDSALYYLDIANARKDSIFGEDKNRELQLLLLDEERRAQEVQRAEERFQNNILLIGLVTITTIILAASILLFRSNRIEQKTNLILRQTLNELKATQSQLIQSEKMASLGELTAGIAHEIQNPLNFVNNFSEVNVELLADLKKDFASGSQTSAEELIDGIISNEEKIVHHGKRADAIVKSMLQHSRTSSGHKELTDMNALCDEYLRLAYHGYRAKDKSFNAEYTTHFAPSIPKINVVPQDIGRVLLNLINNAFYAVNEKSKASSSGYTPIVKIITRNLGDKVEIRIEDNGMGISDSIKEKIFQPFFSTKPTGQGTGLGLSLSYDIVKAHGGTLEVNSKEGEQSEFIILLPPKAE